MRLYGKTGDSLEWTFQQREVLAAYLFPKDGYDLTVDTHSMTSADGTEQIYAHCFFMNA